MKLLHIVPLLYREDNCLIRRYYSSLDYLVFFSDSNIKNIAKATGAFVNMQCGAKTYKYTRLNWLASRMLLQQKNRTLLEKKKKSYGITNVNMFDFEPQTNFRSCFQKSSSSNHDPSGKEINLVCLSRPPQSVAINISNHCDLQAIDQIRQDVENTIMNQVFI